MGDQRALKIGTLFEHRRDQPFGNYNPTKKLCIDNEC